jgi:hypothetical protein
VSGTLILFTKRAVRFAALGVEGGCAVWAPKRVPDTALSSLLRMRPIPPRTARDLDRFPTLCSEVTCDGNLAAKGVFRSQRIGQGETRRCIIGAAGKRKWKSSLEAKLDGFSAGN